MKNDIKKEAEKQEQILLNFLCRTRQGEYAKIDEDSLHYVRVKEQREEIETITENFYYEVS